MMEHNEYDNKCMTGRFSKKVNYILSIILFADLVIASLISRIPLSGILIATSIAFLFLWLIVFLLYLFIGNIVMYIVKRPYRTDYQAILRITLALIIIFYVPFFCIIFRETNYGSRLSGCETSMKNMATSLDMYSTDYGVYPPSLDYIKGEYIRELPVCYGPFPTRLQEVFPEIFPTASPMTYGYNVSDRGDNFTLWCNMPKGHNINGVIYEHGGWPQYSPKAGGILRGAGDIKQ